MKELLRWLFNDRYSLGYKKNPTARMYFSRKYSIAELFGVASLVGLAMFGLYALIFQP